MRKGHGEHEETLCFCPVKKVLVWHFVFFSFYKRMSDRCFTLFFVSILVWFRCLGARKYTAARLVGVKIIPWLVHIRSCGALHTILGEKMRQNKY